MSTRGKKLKKTQIKAKIGQKMAGSESSQGRDAGDKIRGHQKWQENQKQDVRHEKKKKTRRQNCQNKT